MERVIKAARNVFIEALVRGHLQAKKDDTHHVIAEQVGLLKEDSVHFYDVAAVAALVVNDPQVLAITEAIMIRILEELDFAVCAKHDITTVEPFLPVDEDDTLTIDDGELIEVNLISVPA